nr:diaminopimelate epimerase [Desulfobulbaceae bacterium]
MTRNSLNFPIPFTKMTGTGNDFIIVDHRQPFLSTEDASALARLACRRRFSAGADGLILIENSEAVNFKWQFFNADGSQAEMCGNGARCAARYAYTKSIAPAKMRFSTTAGIIEAEMVGEGVKIQLTRPENLQINQTVMVRDNKLAVHSVNTGVPHAVVFTDDIRGAPVVEWGRAIRNHQLFAPAGTNVNFVQVTGPNRLNVRTYERGVEDETMACGTGAVASAIIASLSAQVTSPTSVVTSGGEILIIHFSKDGEDTVTEVFLEGPAHFIYEGQMYKEALLG